MPAVNRPRGWLAAAVALAAAASLLAAAPAPPAFGNHTPAQEGKTWALATTVQSIPYDATHYNKWRCTRTAHCRNPEDGNRINYNDTYETSCAVNAFTGKSEGGSAGCDHNAAAGFRYVSHRTEYPSPPSFSLRFCDRDMGAGAGKTAVDGNGHPLTGTGYCGTWTPDCGEFVSGAGTDAEHRHDTGTGHRACDIHVWDTSVCPSWTAGHGHSSVSTNADKHSHRSGGHTDCQPAHTPPECLPGVPDTESGTWTPDHATGTSGHPAVALLGCDPQSVT